ncbi:DUF1499 domain-containing protein [Litoribrevibacter euphylliae]|uniref:DUF1499 domain-containing protein n=1 Tax=Litoribrevibacter euphylliae TaxID=1834034 RepID=A0ABV7HKJ7_9GAMM
MFQKILLWVFVVLFILSAALYTRFYTLGHESQGYTALGLEQGLLSPCPDKPNCVNSEFPDDQSHYIAPLLITDSEWNSLKITLRQAIRQDGGTVTNVQEFYMAAEYQSSWFGFVDDLELRFDPNQSLLHIRSGSRVGYSDLDVNSERTNRLKGVIEQLLVIN